MSKGYETALPASSSILLTESIVEQTCDHPISVAAILICQLDDIVGQPVFVDTSLRSFALCGSMLPKCAAGPALGNAKLLPHTVDAFATTRRA